MNRLLVISVLAAAISGCRTTSDYNVSIRNVGGSVINDAHVSYSDFQSVGGIIVPGGGCKHLFPDHPIPETATVEWRTEDGVMHREEVEVLKLVPKGFRGDIQFEIDDDNSVTVRLIPEQPE